MGVTRAVRVRRRVLPAVALGLAAPPLLLPLPALALGGEQPPVRGAAGRQVLVRPGGVIAESLRLCRAAVAPPGGGAGR